MLKKIGSDKRFKLPSRDKSAARAPSEGEEEEELEYEDGEAPAFLEQNGGEDGEDDLELPPPMKPITETILVATGNGPPGSTTQDELPGKRVTSLVSSPKLCNNLEFISMLSARLKLLKQIVNYKFKVQKKKKVR